jgi:hypothetical protein
MIKYRRKENGKIGKIKKNPNPVYRVQSLAARFERPKTSGKKK